MNSPKLGPLEYVSVRQSHRIYIVFTAQPIPLWSPLIRWGIRKYQKQPVTWTHALLILQDMTRQTCFFYEMSVWQGMDAYTVDYDSVRYNHDTSELTIAQENHYGVIQELTYHALDVTAVTNTDIEYNWYSSLTEVRLTPWTLLRHLLPVEDKLTWTCSGLVQALLGMPKYQAYTKPLTPDQLHDYYSIR